MTNRPAITLVELLVVLFVLGLGSALVAPALIFPVAEPVDPVRQILADAVELAAAREETVELAVAGDGAWRLTASSEPRPLSEGRLPDPVGPGFVLRVSPLGTCGALPGADPPFPFDPLTCEPS